MGLQIPIAELQSVQELKEGTLKMDYLLRDVRGLPAFRYLNLLPITPSRSKQHAYLPLQTAAEKDPRKGHAPVTPKISDHESLSWVHDCFLVSNSKLVILILSLRSLPY